MEDWFKDRRIENSSGIFLNLGPACLQIIRNEHILLAVSGGADHAATIHGRAKLK